jgi:hypothetical protein
MVIVELPEDHLSENAVSRDKYDESTEPDHRHVNEVELVCISTSTLLRVFPTSRIDEPFSCDLGWYLPV